MGEGEVETPSKSSKSSSAQEQPPSSPATVCTDWASLQAYYNSGGTTPIPPPGFFHSSVASSPQGHPYMWAPQIISSYGAPPQAFVTMYPPGALYPHPLPPGSHPYSPYAMPSTNLIAESSVTAASGMEVDGKENDGKERSPLKRSKGSLGSLNMLTGKVNEVGKSSGASTNGIVPQSGDSGSEDSSEGTEENSANGSQQKKGDEHGSGDEMQNGSEVAQMPHMATGLNQTTQLVAIPQGTITGPTTTLNIGMDYWGGSTAASVSTVRAKLPATPCTAALVPSTVAVSRDGVPSDLLDDRELKRERRKQSNRESARRSRLRKQAECEELGRRVVTLKEENDALREDLRRVQEECEKLASENALLTERFQNNRGKDKKVDAVQGDNRPDCNSSIAENN